MAGSAVATPPARVGRSAPELDRATVLDALHKIATAIANSSDPDALAALAARCARRLLDSDDLVVYVWDPDSARLRLVHAEHGRRPSRVRPIFAAGEGAVGVAFERGRPVFVSDYAEWKRALPELVSSGVKCAVAVPIRVATRTIGVMAARFFETWDCEPEHVQALELLAGQIATLLGLEMAVPVPHRLSPREREVLTLLACGATNRQIGARLSLSPGTVKKHVEHILKKLEVADRTQAAVRAAQLGLVERTA